MMRLLKAITIRRIYLSLLLLMWAAWAGVGLYDLSLRPQLAGKFFEKSDSLFYQMPQQRDSVNFVPGNNPEVQPQEDGELGSAGAKEVPVHFSELDHFAVSHLNDVPVERHFEARQQLYRMQIGQELRIRTHDGPVIIMQLTQYYGRWQMILKGLVSLFFFIISTIIWLNRQNDGEKYFAIAGYLFGYTIVSWWPGLHLSMPLATLLRVTDLIAYPQAIFAFLHFSYYFPTPVLPQNKLRFRRMIFQTMGFTIGVILVVLFLVKTFRYTPESTAFYYQTYQVFRWLVLALFGTAIYNMIKNEEALSNPVTQRKLQWVIGGCFWGLMPFLLFWNLPLAFGSRPLLPDWGFDLFFIVPPLSIAIAILKYRLFDIEIVFSRSLAYGIVITLLGLIYMAAVGGMSSIIFHEFALDSSPYLSISAALLVAILFNPLKNRVQNFINRKFLRIRYDRFNRMRIFLNKAETCSEEAPLLQTLADHYHDAVPLEDQVFLVRREGKWQAFREADAEKAMLLLEWLRDRQYSEMIINEDGLKKVEKGMLFHMEMLPEPWLVLMPVGENILWMMSVKQSKTRFWEEDLDLARQMARATALQWDKITYFQMMIRESLEKEQAQSLSKWKSILVAEVAHDLRAPLNTMLWKLKKLERRFAENGGDGEPIDDLRRQIHRLQAFVHNMLVLSDLEQGEHKISLSEMPLREHIDIVLAEVAGVLQLKSLKVSVNCDDSLKILGDPIVFQEIILNLVDNAAKFSAKGGKIIIAAARTANKKNPTIEVSVTDSAGGIPKEKLKQLFEPFGNERALNFDRKDGNGDSQGFSLGLYIAREFTALLNGKLDVQSKSDQGTTFRMTFAAVSEPKEPPKNSAGKPVAKNRRTSRKGKSRRKT